MPAKIPVAADRRRGVSLLELLVATTILAIVALAAGGIFGKLYAMFGKNAEVVKATRIANELIGRYQIRWRLDPFMELNACETQGGTAFAYCYQLDLFRDTQIGGNPQTISEVTPQARQLAEFTAWMDVADVKAVGADGSAADSDWLMAKTVKIRIYRANDVLCMAGSKFDPLGLPELLRAGLNNTVDTAQDTYFQLGKKKSGATGGLRQVVHSYHYDPGLGSLNPCFVDIATTNPGIPLGAHSRGVPGEFTGPTPAPLVEVATTLVRSPRTQVARRGVEFVRFKNGALAHLQPYSPGIPAAKVTYFDPDAPAGSVTTEGRPTRECLKNLCTVDFYREAYPGVLFEPPSGWIPEAETGVLTFDPAPVARPDGTSLPADPVVRYILWTYAGPEIASTAQLRQFRHRLSITTFTDRLVHAGSLPGFLTTLPQAAGLASDNYIPLYVSVTSLPDANGNCVDELVPEQAAVVVGCASTQNFNRVVVPVFPSRGNAPYEATFNIPPGPTGRIITAATAPRDTNRLPNIYGLPSMVRPLAAGQETNASITRLGSQGTHRYWRPHLVHIHLPRPYLAAKNINLTIARVRFAS